MPFIVGLTGGIGSGKTSATKIFSNLGVDIIDTDKIARALTQSGGAAMGPIRKIFGENIIAANGALDRRKMREKIFSDSMSKKILEETLHPLIYTETVHHITLTKSPYIIIVIPLLFETKDYNNMIQRTLVIDCDEQKQIARTMARSKLEEQEVRVIMEAQISRQERLQKADDIIINNEDLDSLRKQVLDRHHKYLDLAKNS